MYKGLLYRHWESSLLDWLLFPLVFLKSKHLGLLVKHNHIRLLLRGNAAQRARCLNLVVEGELSTLLDQPEIELGVIDEGSNVAEGSSRCVGSSTTCARSCGALVLHRSWVRHF